jgi:hypothetical protein
VLELILIGGLLAALALLAQLLAPRIGPPPPIASRVPIRVARTPAGIEVEVGGVRGLALSFHRAEWDPPAAVVEVSGPPTLRARRDVRRYVLAPGAGPKLALRGVWDQLMLREISLAVDLAYAIETAAGDDGATARRPAAGAAPSGRPG